MRRFTLISLTTWWMLGLVIPLLVLMLVFGFPSRASGLTLDAAALSSSTTRQVMMSGSHLHEFDKAVMEISGKYIKSAGREDLWDAGIAQMFQLPRGMRIEDDFRRYSTHTTFSGGAGWGVHCVTVTAGIRTEYADGAQETFGKLAGNLKAQGDKWALSSTVELLKASSTQERIDYRLKGTYRVAWWHVYLALEEVRQRKVQGVGFGVSLF